LARVRPHLCAALATKITTNRMAATSLMGFLDPTRCPKAAARSAPRRGHHIRRAIRRFDRAHSRGSSASGSERTELQRPTISYSAGRAGTTRGPRARPCQASHRTAKGRNPRQLAFSTRPCRPVYAARRCDWNPDTRIRLDEQDGCYSVCLRKISSTRPGGGSTRPFGVLHDADIIHGRRHQRSLRRRRPFEVVRARHRTTARGTESPAKRDGLLKLLFEVPSKKLGIRFHSSATARPETPHKWRKM